MAGQETAILTNPHTGAEHEFSAGHAWAIMLLPNNGGWEWKGEPPPCPPELQADEDCGCNDKKTATDADTGEPAEAKAGSPEKGAQKRHGKGKKA